MNSLDALLSSLFKEELLLSATLSDPTSKERLKCTLRPLLIKKERCYQLSSYYKNKALHTNLSPVEAEKELKKLISIEFKQGLLHTADYTYILVRNKEGEVAIKRKKSKTNILLESHNRPKSYLLSGEEGAPFFCALGITGLSGKVYPSMQDKFKQINRFLEIVSDLLPKLDGQKTLRILDFGCGKAYLTFALYYYLTQTLSYNVELTGIDLKKDVIDYCQALAQKLGYSSLQFIHGDINSYSREEPIDLMVSLHACDTATDAALEKAIRLKAKLILAVPCCQHEVAKQINAPILKPILEHGILKEHFSALVTDAARGKLLELSGYKVQILEFIDKEETAKNILIRASILPTPPDKKRLEAEYEAFTSLLNIRPTLERLIK